MTTNTITQDYETTNQVLLDAGFEPALDAVKENQEQERKTAKSAVNAIDVTYVYVSVVKDTTEFEEECKDVGCMVRLPDAVNNPFLKANKLICGQVKVKDNETTFIDLDRENTSKRAMVHKYLHAMDVPAEPGEAKIYIENVDLGGGSVSTCLAKARRHFNAAPPVQNQIAAITKRIGETGNAIDEIEVEELPSHGVVAFAVVEGKFVIIPDFATGGDGDFLSRAGDIEPDIGVFARFHSVAKDHGHTGDAKVRKATVYGHNDGKAGRSGFHIQQCASYGSPYIRCNKHLNIPAIQFKASTSAIDGLNKMWLLFPWYETDWVLEASNTITVKFPRKRRAEIKKVVDAGFEIPDVFKPTKKEDEYVWPLDQGFPEHDEVVNDPYVSVDHAGRDIVAVPSTFVKYVANRVTAASHNPKDRICYENGVFLYVTESDGQEEICGAPGCNDDLELKLTAVEFNKAFKAMRKFTKHGELKIALAGGHWILFKYYAGLEFGVVLENRKEG